MSTTLEISAYVLRTVKYGESDMIVTLLGRETGKFSAIARGARASKRRFGGSLLPMRSVLATASFKKNRDMATLVGASVERDFRGIEADFDKITIASYITELVRAVSKEGDEDPAVFDLLTRAYEQLAGAQKNLAVFQVVLHHFELRLLELHGARPELHACHRCGLSVKEFEKLRCTRGGEGLVCRDCVRSHEAYGVLRRETLDVLHYLETPQGTPPDAIAEPAPLLQARRVIEASLEPLIDYELKSRAMLETVLAQDAKED